MKTISQLLILTFLVSCTFSKRNTKVANTLDLDSIEKVYLKKELYGVDSVLLSTLQVSQLVEKWNHAEYKGLYKMMPSFLINVHLKNDSIRSFRFYQGLIKENGDKTFSIKDSLLMHSFWTANSSSPKPNNFSHLTEKDSVNRQYSLGEHSDLIDLVKESKLKYSDYLLTFNKSDISLCCHDDLHDPIGALTTPKENFLLLGFELKIDTTEYAYNNIYSKDNSIFKVVELRHETSGEDDVFIGKGRLVDSSMTLSKGIKIGMNKKEFFDKFFIYPNESIERIKQITVCEDERGHLFTKYNFAEGKLIEIEFGCP